MSLFTTTTLDNGHIYSSPKYYFAVFSTFLQQLSLDNGHIYNSPKYYFAVYQAFKNSHLLITAIFRSPKSIILLYI